MYTTCQQEKKIIAVPINGFEPTLLRVSQLCREWLCPGMQLLCKYEYTLFNQCCMPVSVSEPHAVDGGPCGQNVQQSDAVD